MYAHMRGQYAMAAICFCSIAHGAHSSAGFGLLNMLLGRLGLRMNGMGFCDCIRPLFVLLHTFSVWALFSASSALALNVRTRFARTELCASARVRARLHVCVCVCVRVACAFHNKELFIFISQPVLLVDTMNDSLFCLCLSLAPFLSLCIGAFWVLSIFRKTQLREICFRPKQCQARRPQNQRNGNKMHSNVGGTGKAIHIASSPRHSFTM